jgi:hypothetical protein
MHLKVKRPLVLMMTSIKVRRLSVWVFGFWSRPSVFKRRRLLFWCSEEDPLLSVLLLTFRQRNRSHTGSSFLPEWKISVSLGGRLGLASSPLGCIINLGIFENLVMLLHSIDTSRQRSLTLSSIDTQKVQWNMVTQKPLFQIYESMHPYDKHHLTAIRSTN